MAKTEIDLALPLGVFLPLVILSNAAVWLRVYTRLKIVKSRLQLDDWFIIIAFIIFSCQAIATLIGFKHGVGVHRKLLEDDPSNLLYVARLKWADSWLYFVSTALIKFSIISLYRRIFLSTRYLRISLNLLFAFVILHSVAGAVSIVFNCWPVAYYWNRNLPGYEGKCASEKIVWFVFVGSNSLTDFATVLLPMPLVGGLKMNRRKKMGLMGVFALSLVPCAISIIRYHSLSRIDDPDYTFWIWPALLWGGIEIYCAFICACLPALVPLLYTYSPSFKSFMNMENRSRVDNDDAIHEQWLYTPDSRALAFEMMGEKSPEREGFSLPSPSWGSFMAGESDEAGGWKEGMEMEMAKGGGRMVVVESSENLRMKEGERGIQVDTEISVLSSEIAFIRNSWLPK